MSKADSKNCDNMCTSHPTPYVAFSKGFIKKSFLSYITILGLHMKIQKILSNSCKVSPECQ